MPVQIIRQDSRAAAYERFEASRRGEYIPPPSPIKIIETEGDTLQGVLSEMFLAAGLDNLRRNGGMSKLPGVTT